MVDNNEIRKEKEKRVDEISKGDVKIERKEIKKIGSQENPYSKMDENNLRNYIKKSSEPIYMLMSFSPNEISNESELKSKFNFLIKTLVNKEDPQLMEALWNMRKQLLYHRICYEAIFYSKGNVVGGIKCYAMGLEGGQDIVNYFMGVSVDVNYADFHTLVKKFEAEAKSKGYGNVGIFQSPTGRGKSTIDNISLKISVS